MKKHYFLRKSFSMEKEQFNVILREYVKNNLSPTQYEKDLVTRLYSSIQKAIGSNCYLVGSFARYTAIHPMHDIDILFVAGNFDPTRLDPKSVLATLNSKLINNFINPTDYKFQISLQTHSLSVLFIKNEKEEFSVDIIPGFISGIKNEYEQDIYYVPEIMETGHSKRLLLYEELNRSKTNEIDWWIKSDPRGYIQLAQEVNQKNKDFRHTVKFIKRWKHNCKESDANFKLKSFHIEQVILEYYRHDNTLTIFDAVFRFFYEIPSIIEKPQIHDRADYSIMIDEYISCISTSQKNKIIQARDCFLIKLEKFKDGDSAASLVQACFTKRLISEQYLFDFGIPTLINPAINFRIDGKVRKLNGFSDGWLNETPQLQKGLTIGINCRKINFSIRNGGYPDYNYTMWKVKNDDNCKEPRGEITKNHTLCDPESTAYPGNHYVECYAIKDNICIARSRSNVKIISSDYEEKD